MGRRVWRFQTRPWVLAKGDGGADEGLVTLVIFRVQSTQKAKRLTGLSVQGLGFRV